MRATIVACALAALILCRQASAEDEIWSLHGQTTLVWQYHPAFRSNHTGANSLDPGSRGDETIDATLYAGARLWDGGELYIDPESDQGFGISDTVGLAGYANGEGSKVGKATPYFRLPRLFFRQTFDLGGETETVAPDANQLGASHTADRVVVTVGKFSAVDIFDDNEYAHDPKRDFLNWAIIDSSAYDYAADAWGYSYGAATEWTEDWWTIRAGLFDMSRVPNGTELETSFAKFELVSEAEARYSWDGRSGAVKLLGFVNRAPMGSYEDALRLASTTGTTPDTALVRSVHWRPGGAINLEQQIGEGIGFFLRASLNDGSEEAYEFTEINKSVAAGFAFDGTLWGRPDDAIGLATAINGLSRPAQEYFAAGGLGILIGDGELPDYATEDIVETYYSAAIIHGLTATLDYQWTMNPAYNADRGPVSVFGLRVHAEF